MYLASAHGDFWRTGHRLPPGAVEPAPIGGPGVAPRASTPDVVAVVPARNEADVLPETLPKLLAQDYPGNFRVIVVDDRSDDGTAKVAARLGRNAGLGGSRVTVLTGQPRPDGWAGKVWAMSQGFAAAEDGDYVLFTDADIAWTPGALRRLVAAAEADDRQLLSQMVLLRTATAWEKHIVPAFVYFFAQLYPFRRASDPRSKIAAGAGGCQLIKRAALAKAGGLEPIKGALIDDVALATLLKRNGNRIWLGLTTEIASARPYPKLADLWQMIARSAYYQLRYNPLLLAGTIVGLLFIYLVPPAGVIAGLIATAAGDAGGASLALWEGLAAWFLMAFTYWPMLRLYRLSALRAPTLPLIALLYAAMTVDSARRHYAGRAIAWRAPAENRSGADT
jgi:hopene-associated glycosyltransferase HpnB